MRKPPITALRGVKHDRSSISNGSKRAEVTVELELRGRGSVTGLATVLTEMGGVLDVRVGDTEVAFR